MKEISLEELFDLYLDTLGHCGSNLRHRSVVEVEYALFEEFDLGATTFLHDSTLTRLLKAGYITQEAQGLSRELRQRWLQLQKTPCVTEDIWNHCDWRALFDVADRLTLMFPKPPPGELE